MAAESNTGTIVALIVGVAFLCGFIGAAVGSAKGNTAAGFFLGLLFGPFGILIVAVMSPTGQAQPIPPPPGAEPAQWAADPFSRHEHRWWNGSRWTETVADGGVKTVDPPTPDGWTGGRV